MNIVDTTLDAFDTPAVKVPRDHWDRPLVVPPEGGKPVAYTRCTTFVGALDDTFNLDRWKQRMVALGLADRPDLLLSVAAHRDNKNVLNQIIDRAREAAAASASATVGTATHALAEQLDRGQRLGVIPADAQADLAAYQRAMTGLIMLEIEQFGVCDELKIAGTWDRVVGTTGPGGGRAYIADIKTGGIDWAGLKIAQQLAVYAHCVPYDPATGRRVPRDFEVDRDWAVVIHLPAGTGTCTLLRVPINRGWDAVACSAQVRSWRAVKDWFTPFNPAPPPDLTTAIALARSVEQLRALWTDAVTAGTWTDAHLVAAMARKIHLEKGTAA